MAWYVIYTKPKQEVVAWENLERQGFPVYCPKITLKRRSSSGWKDVTEPLFPRYLFVQLTEGEDSFSPIRSTHGVSKMLRFGNRPAQISEQAIDAIKLQEQQLQQIDNESFPWNPGDKVEIMEGPFAGLIGIFQERSDQQRVYLLLDLLGKDNRIKISISDVT